MATDEQRLTYRLQENIAAIAADVHADERLQSRIDKTEESFPDRLAWIIDAGNILTRLEPKGDYEEDDLDWYEVTERIADGFYANESAEAAVHAALNPPAYVPPTAESVLRKFVEFFGDRDPQEIHAEYGDHIALTLIDARRAMKAEGRAS